MLEESGIGEATLRWNNAKGKEGEGLETKGETT